MLLTSLERVRGYANITTDDSDGLSRSDSQRHGPERQLTIIGDGSLLEAELGAAGRHEVIE